MFSVFFHDKRLVAIIFFLWSCFVLVMFWMAGILESRFVHFGPSAQLKFLDYSIDTWVKWTVVATFGVFDSAIWVFAHEAIHPWEINTVLDPKSHILPYSKTTCLLILESYYLHGVVLGPFAFWISLTQIDFVLLKGFSTILMKTYSHYEYISNKEFRSSSDIDTVV